MSETTRTPDDVRASVSSIYSDLLRKRSIEREQKEEMKRVKAEEKKQKKEEEKAEKKDHMTKAEKRKAEIDAWKEIVIGLTGEDLEYSDKGNKGSRKKYRKWIGDDGDSTTIKSDKVKKVKKKNYQKEFAPELNMLKAVLAEQNRFSADLLKRFQNMAGPNTKDAAPLNKTMVELVSAINASRSNSLGMLKQIGDIKKTIADLYMKQKKLDADLKGSGAGIDDTDLTLMGSDIARSMFGDSPQSSSQSFSSPSMNPTMMSGQGVVSQQTTMQMPQQDPNPSFTGSTFDPESWEGGPEFDANTESVIYETIPHQVVVEYHKNEGTARFKAVRTDNGEELVGAPLPGGDPSKLRIDEEKMRVKGPFDELYPLEII